MCNFTYLKTKLMMSKPNGTEPYSSNTAFRKFEGQTSITISFKTHSDTGLRWKGQRRGVFSICWTEAGDWPEEVGGSLQAVLLQEPRWPPQCEPPLDGGLEGVEREGPWVCASPPPGFGAFCMALWIKRKNKWDLFHYSIKSLFCLTNNFHNK